jgi:hypothetical protein
VDGAGQAQGWAEGSDLIPRTAETGVEIPFTDDDLRALSEEFEGLRSCCC